MQDRVQVHVFWREVDAIAQDRVAGGPARWRWTEALRTGLTAGRTETNRVRTRAER